MARTPSLTISEAEAQLGPRPIRATAENRPILRKWATAHGFPFLFVAGLSLKELGMAYNGEQDMLGKLRAKLANAEQDNGGEESAEAVSADVDETGMTHAVASNNVSTSSGHDGKGHKVLQALQELIEGTATQQTINEDSIRAVVRDEINKNISVQRIEVLHRSGQITTIDGHFHPNFPTLCRMAVSFGHDGYVPGIFLSGEASSGKTYACKMLAKALGLPWHFNGAISQPHEMLGFIDGPGNYHRTPFREAYEHGGVYTFDEVDRSNDRALLAVNPHLANGVATFPDKQIARHPNCIIVCTANTWGTGATAQYSGATKLDAAFLSRFPMRLSWNIDLALEMQISGNEAWCARVQKARAKAQAAGLKVMIDVRMTLAGSAMIAVGFTPDHAAKHTYLANLSPEQAKMVEG